LFAISAAAPARFTNNSRVALKVGGTGGGNRTGRSEEAAVRASTIVMMGCAVLFGLLAVFVAQTWLEHQAQLRHTPADAPAQPVVTRTVVVAAAPLKFGTHLSSQVLREVAWPEGAIPSGTFSSVGELLADGRRIVLSAIQPNEPILRTKITGPGQKATLSAVIQEGMKAVTIRVNDVEGVAGFVLPGDHVDVLMTRQADKASGSTDVVLQNVRVLAIDQMADDSSDKPTVVKAVTLEVGTVEAQKLSLAGTIGALSLALRKAGESAIETSRRITTGDLGSSEAPRARSRFATVVVLRGGAKGQDFKSQEYSVPVESGDWREARGATPLRAQR
jgi:pilus assembly protein CpaB